MHKSGLAYTPENLMFKNKSPGQTLMMPYTAFVRGPFAGDDNG
jgi:hypothetical protein